MTDISAAIWRKAGFKTRLLADAYVAHNDDFASDVYILRAKLMKAESEIAREIKKLITEKYQKDLDEFTITHEDEKAKAKQLANSRPPPPVIVATPPPVVLSAPVVAQPTPTPGSLLGLGPIRIKVPLTPKANTVAPVTVIKKPQPLQVRLPSTQTNEPNSPDSPPPPPPPQPQTVMSITAETKVSNMVPKKVQLSVYHPQSLTETKVNDYIPSNPDRHDLLVQLLKSWNLPMSDMISNIESLNAIYACYPVEEP